jgi:hypothetical protein
VRWQAQGPVRVSFAQALVEAAVAAAAAASADRRAGHGGSWVGTGYGSAMIRMSVPKTKGLRVLGQPSSAPA